MISYVRSFVLPQFSVEAVLCLRWRILLLSLNCLFSYLSRVWSVLCRPTDAELLQILIVAICLVEVGFRLIFITNNVARVLVPYNCLDVVYNSHVVSVCAAINVIDRVLLPLHLVPLHELGLGMDLLPCACASGNSTLFVIHLNRVTAVAECSRACSVLRQA